MAGWAEARLPGTPWRPEPQASRVQRDGGDPPPGLVGAEGHRLDEPSPVAGRLGPRTPADCSSEASRGDFWKLIPAGPECRVGADSAPPWVWGGSTTPAFSSPYWREHVRLLAAPWPHAGTSAPGHCGSLQVALRWALEGRLSWVGPWTPWPVSFEKRQRRRDRQRRPRAAPGAPSRRRRGGPPGPSRRDFGFLASRQRRSCRCSTSPRVGSPAAAAPGDAGRCPGRWGGQTSPFLEQVCPVPSGSSAPDGRASCFSLEGHRSRQRQAEQDEEALAPPHARLGPCAVRCPSAAAPNAQLCRWRERTSSVPTRQRDPRGPPTVLITVPRLERAWSRPSAGALGPQCHPSAPELAGLPSTSRGPCWPAQQEPGHRPTRTTHADGHFLAL
nr:collagen alpha-1(I) chain-like [Dasypus novemcinctus]